MDWTDEINAIIDDEDTAIDQKLDAIILVLYRIEPALLDRSASLADEELEQGLLDFVVRREVGESPGPRRTILVIGQHPSQAMGIIFSHTSPSEHLNPLCLAGYAEMLPVP